LRFPCCTASRFRSAPGVDGGAFPAHPATTRHLRSHSSDETTDHCSKRSQRIGECSGQSVGLKFFSRRRSRLIVIALLPPVRLNWWVGLVVIALEAAVFDSGCGTAISRLLVGKRTSVNPRSRPFPFYVLPLAAMTQEVNQRAASRAEIAARRRTRGLAAEDVGCADTIYIEFSA